MVKQEEERLRIEPVGASGSVCEVINDGETIGRLIREAGSICWDADAALEEAIGGAHRSLDPLSDNTREYLARLLGEAG